MASGASSELVAGGEVAVQYDGETCLAQVLKARQKTHWHVQSVLKSHTINETALARKACPRPAMGHCHTFESADSDGFRIHGSAVAVGSRSLSCL